MAIQGGVPENNNCEQYLEDIIGADVLVIGTVAQRGITGKLLGNTAEKILVKTDCDLLVVN
jgi:nucleotide-binding universal stress UspA family protein